jgi:hypothetical protein
VDKLERKDAAALALHAGHCDHNRAITDTMPDALARPPLRNPDTLA